MLSLLLNKKNSLAFTGSSLSPTIVGYVAGRNERGQRQEDEFKPVDKYVAELEGNCNSASNSEKNHILV